MLSIVFKPHHLLFLALLNLLGCQPSSPQTSSSPVPTVAPTAAPTAMPTPISSPAPTPSAKPAAFDETFELGQGRPVVFPDGLILDFFVENDSRCPEGVTCIWAGEVQSAFSFTQSGSPETFSLTLSSTGEAATLDYKGYTLTLFAVDPYPTQQATPVHPVATVKLSTSLPTGG